MAQNKRTVRDDEGLLNDLELGDLEELFKEMEEEGHEGGEASTNDDTIVEVETETKEKITWENDDEENFGYDEE